MTDPTEETGIIEVLLQRLNDFRLPRLLELQERVNGGGQLSDYDIEFLETALEDAKGALPYTDHHPELQPLAAKLTALYHEIVERGVENAKRGQS